MGLFALEYQQRTFELLLTSPVTTWQVVLGKYLGAMGLCVLLLLSTAHVPATVYYFANPDWGRFAGGYLTLLLVQSVLISMGMVASACSRSQLVALVLSFAGSLGLYILGWLSDDPAGWLAQISLAGHVEDVLKGSLRLSDLAYFVVFTWLMLFISQQRLESFRWS
jgi:ABC-2 type transport system permease protein